MTGCTLQFSKNSPLRTTLIDLASGCVKYQIDTPIKITGSVTRIRKLESGAEPPKGWKDDSDSESEYEVIDKKAIKEKSEESDSNEPDDVPDLPQLPELPEAKDEIARIYWHWFSKDRIIFQGKITTRNEFLPKSGKLKGDFMFTGPDGIQYRWDLGAKRKTKLVTANDEKLIAEFHQAKHIIKKEKAKLEIKPEGMHMLDHIVLTFAFVEETRRNREVEIATAGH